MSVVADFYNKVTKSFVRAGVLQYYHDNVDHIVLAKSPYTGILGIAENVTSRIEGDVLVFDKITDGKVTRSGTAKYFWLMDKNHNQIDYGTLGGYGGVFVTEDTIFTLSPFTVTQDGVDKEEVPDNMYIKHADREFTPATKPDKCPYCRSRYVESVFHPGTCTNCGGFLD